MPDAAAPILLVGLGNPGAEYARHRHNVGFLAVDAIAAHARLAGPAQKFHGQLFSGSLDGQQLLALKPDTYMNDSGRAVQAAAAFYKIPPGNIIVFHDELDLPPGEVRLKRGGGAAGHNGLRSIDAALGQDYWRVRIGIGHPGHKDLVTPHVLGNFTGGERTAMDALLDRLAAGVPDIVAGKLPQLYLTLISE